MPRSDQSDARRSSVIPLLLALVVLSAAIAVLSFLTLGFFGAVLGLAFALAAFIGLQYLIWGWWLGPWIERAERLRQEGRDGDDETDG
jgi:hypothetical protein